MNKISIKIEYKGKNDFEYKLSKVDRKRIRQNRRTQELKKGRDASLDMMFPNSFRVGGERYKYR